MEFVIGFALVAFFWYLAYRAWKDRVPGANRPLTVLVAHDVRTADYYMERMGLYFDSKVRIATREIDLYGFRPEDTNFIYVNSDNGKPDPQVIERLRVMEACGAEVNWLGYAPEEA